MKRALVILAQAILLLGATAASTACLTAIYQPRTPKSLMK